MGSAPRPPPRSMFRNQALSSPPPNSRLAPHSKAGRSRRKKALSRPTPGHSSTFRFLCRSKSPPETAQTSRGARLSSRFHPDGHGRWGAQPERTRTKKGLTSGGEERGENAGPGGRGLGLCRPVELTPSSCPQRPSSQLPSVLEFGMPCAPRRATRGMSPAARSWHCGDSGTLSPRSHLPLPASARGLRNQPSKGYTTRSTRRPRGQRRRLRE